MYLSVLNVDTSAFFVTDRDTCGNQPKKKRDTSSQILEYKEHRELSTAYERQYRDGSSTNENPDRANR